MIVIKKIIYILIGVVVILGFFLFNRADKNFSYEDAVKKIDNGAVLIDVRTVEEYNSGHAKGAINIPLDIIETSELVPTDKNAELVLYCRSGNRSSQAKSILESKGYKNVYNLGGFSQWKGEKE